VLCPTIKTQDYTILFADDTNMSSHPEIYFQNCMNDVFAGLNRQTKANKLTLHDDKTNFMELCTNNKSCANLNVEYDDKTNEEVETTKFLGLQINNNLNWKTCVQYIIPMAVVPYL
jgi:hypothetical protein